MSDKKMLVLLLSGILLASCAFNKHSNRLPASGDRVGTPIEGSLEKIVDKSCDLYQVSYSKDELDENVKSIIEEKGYKLVEKYKGEGSLLLFTTKSWQGPEWIRSSTSTTSTNGRTTNDSSVLTGPVITNVNMALSKSFSKINEDYFHISKPIFEANLKDDQFPQGYNDQDHEREVLSSVKLGVLRALPECKINSESSNIADIQKQDDSKSLLLQRLLFNRGNQFVKEGLVGSIEINDFEDYDEYSFYNEFYSMRDKLDALDLALETFGENDKFISSNFQDRILWIQKNGEAKIYGPPSKNDELFESFSKNYSFFYRNINRDKFKFTAQYEKLKEHLPTDKDRKNIERFVSLFPEIELKEASPVNLSYDPHATFLTAIVKSMYQLPVNKSEAIEFFVNFLRKGHHNEPFEKYAEALELLKINYMTDKYEGKTVFETFHKFRRRSDNSLRASKNSVKELMRALFIKRTESGVDLNKVSLKCQYSDFHIGIITGILRHRGEVKKDFEENYTLFTQHPSYSDFIFERNRSCTYPEYFKDGMNNFQMALIEFIIQNRTINDVEVLESIINSKADLEFKNAQGQNGFQLIDDFDAPKENRRVRSRLEKTLKKLYKKYKVSRK